MKQLREKFNARMYEGSEMKAKLFTRSVFLCFVCLFYYKTLVAGESITPEATISKLELDKNSGLIFISLAGGLNLNSSGPNCNHAVPTYSFKYESVMGPAFLSTLLSAQMADKKVNLFGTGNCENVPDSEGLKKIQIVK